MNTWKPADGEPDADSHRDAAGDDWTRYGLSRRSMAAEQIPEENPAAAPTRDSERAVDDMFIEYRHENGAGVARPAKRARSSRFVANVATLSVIGAAGLAMAVVALVTSPMMPAASPTPGSASPGTSSSPVATPNMAHQGISMTLPMEITIPDRDQTPSDGQLMYLTGPKGGVAVDPGTGEVRVPYGGAPFANGMRRALIDDGLWVSSWPEGQTTCGSGCWPAASTYKIDIATGAVDLALAATYLVGVTSDGVWVATGNQLKRLDPATGATLSTTPWRLPGEPRTGCDLLWVFTPGASGATLAEIDPAGDVMGLTTLDPGITYGPTYIEGQCWMMSGSGGASAHSTTLVRLNPDGTTESVFPYDKSIVTLDKEFWQYTPGGLLQRFEAVSGSRYGVPYVLPIQPPEGDPKWLFAACGSLWMIRGDRLIGLSVSTGRSR